MKLAQAPGIILSSLLIWLTVAAIASTPADTRTVEFTTDEGTWISLDISPDGTKIAFELLGDIYLMPLAGGSAHAVLTGPAFQSQPRFSPDGSLLAFISDETGSDNIWISDADGSHAHSLTKLPRSTVLSPAWARDAKSIFATVIDDRQASIWRYDLATGKGTKVISNGNGAASPLVSTPAPGPYGADVSSDGRSFYFSSVTPRPYGSRNGAASYVARFDLTSGREDHVTLDERIAMKPRLSPDGKFLAYCAQAQGRTGLRLRDLQTGNEHWLRFPLQRNGLESNATRDVLPDYAFAPNGRSIIVAYGGKIHQLDLSSASDQVIPFSAAVSLQIKPPLAFPRRVPQDSVTARFVQQATVSTDGRIAFSALGRIWIKSAATSSRLTVTLNPHEFMPAWSPDGQWIAFVTWSAGGGYVWKVASGGGAPIRLTDASAFWIDPVWTPDGSAILAMRAPTGSAHLSNDMPSDLRLMRVSANGGGTKQISSNSGIRHPHFTSDASRVYVSSPQGLASMKLDGSDWKLQNKLNKAPANATVRISPNGKQVALISGEKLGLFDLNVTDVLDASQISIPAGANPTSLGWSPDGATVHWVTGSVLHQVSAAGSGEDRPIKLAASLPRAAPTGSLVLSDARAITMRGNEVIEHADIVITGNRITAIGAHGSLSIPPQAKVIDASGKTIIPGIVDVHSHWGAVRSELLEPEAPPQYANLAFGVTTIRDPQAPPDIFAYADLADLNETPSPRVFSTGPGIFADTNFQSLDDARKTISRYHDQYGTHLLKSYMVGNRQQRQWMVEASREMQMMPTTEGGADTKMNITHAFDGFSGNEHALPTEPLYRDVVELFARSGITYTPTLIVAFGGALPVYRLHAQERPYDNPKLRTFFPLDDLYQRTATRLLAFPDEDYNVADAAASANAMLAAGGNVALGGHGEMQGLQVHWEMRLFAEGGMKPHDILRVATINGAKAIGYAQDLGSLEPGKLADLVVLDRNPLDDIRATTSIRWVMKNGFLYNGDTLDTVWPNPHPLPDPWWRKTDSPASSVNTSSVDSIAREVMDRQRIPGLAVAVVKGDQVLLSKGYGLANIEQGTPVTAETMFESGSLGKQFTAAAVMLLAESGTLKLTDSVRTYLPDAPPEWQPITIRHLLSHTSGIPDYTGDALDYRRDYSEADLAKLAFGLKLEFPAGARWNYSNTGYVMLGIIVSKVTGRPYWETLREKIFTPAGMPTARIISEADLVPHRAAGYLVDRDGFKNQNWVSPQLNTTADGSLLLSLEDLIAWSRVVRNRKILSKASWDEILSPITLNSGRTYPYGHAWFIEELNGHKVEQHGGSWQGFQTQLSRFEGSDLTVIVLANSRTAVTGPIANQIAAAVDPALTRPAPASMPIADTDPRVTAYTRQILEKTAKGQLALADFEFVRQTIVVRMSQFYAQILSPLGNLKSLVLVGRTEEGDDRVFIYLASFDKGVVRTTVNIGPGGGLTRLQLAKESQ